MSKQPKTQTTQEVWSAIADRLEMRDRHVKEQAQEDFAMKVLFACMLPPVIFFPSFWRS